MIYINIYGSRIPFPPGEEIDLLLRKSDIEEIKHHQLVIKNREGRTIPLGALLYEDDAFNLVEPSEEERKIYPALSVAVLSPDLDKAIKYVNYLNRYGFEAMKMGTLRTHRRLEQEKKFDISVLTFEAFEQNEWELDFPTLIVVENKEDFRQCAKRGVRVYLYNEERPWSFREAVSDAIANLPEPVRNNLADVKRKPCPRDVKFELPAERELIKV